MSNWDKTEPQGTENLNKGAERIREAKDALEVALAVEHSFPNGLDMVHKMPYGNSVTAYDGRWRYNNVTKQIERYNSKRS